MISNQDFYKLRARVESLHAEITKLTARVIEAEEKVAAVKAPTPKPTLHVPKPPQGPKEEAAV